MVSNKGARRLSPQTMRQLTAAGFDHFGTGAEKTVDGTRYLLFRKQNGRWAAGAAGDMAGYDSVKAAIDAVEWEIQRRAKVAAAIHQAEAIRDSLVAIQPDEDEPDEVQRVLDQIAEHEGDYLGGAEWLAELARKAIAAGLDKTSA